MPYAMLDNQPRKMTAQWSLLDVAQCRRQFWADNSFLWNPSSKLVTWQSQKQWCSSLGGSMQGPPLQSHSKQREQDGAVPPRPTVLSPLAKPLARRKAEAGCLGAQGDSQEPLPNRHSGRVDFVRNIGWINIERNTGPVDLQGFHFSTVVHVQLLAGLLQEAVNQK